MSGPIDTNKLLNTCVSFTNMLGFISEYVLEKYVTSVITDNVLRTKLLKTYYQEVERNANVTKAIGNLLKIRNDCAHQKVRFNDRNKIIVYIRNMLDNLNVLNEHLLSKGIKVREIEDIFLEYNSIVTYPVVTKQTIPSDIIVDVHVDRINSPVPLVLSDGNIVTCYNSHTTFTFLESTSPFNEANSHNYCIMRDTIEGIKRRLAKIGYKNRPMRVLYGPRAGYKGFIVSSSGSVVKVLYENSLYPVSCSKTLNIEIYVDRNDLSDE